MNRPTVYGWMMMGLLSATVGSAEPVRCRVEAEEVVTRYVPANNGAGPLWCYGSTVIARHGDNLYLSVIETGKDVPLLCNTRWQLWHRSGDAWRLVNTERDYRQREPCPIAIFHTGELLLSVNPSTQPPGTQYGPCRPMVLEFDSADLRRAPRSHEPAWSDDAYFTDHSYRGFAADGETGELLLLNIHARSGEQYVSFRDRGGRWHARDRIRFPIRSCYPQVALREGAAHVMAIGDIVEPVEQWRTFKFEKLNRQWDYVFRRLFYVHAEDVRSKSFGEPIEVESVEQTCGHIRNLDLHVDENQVAHLLYTRQPIQYAFIRDRFFPGQPMTIQLQYVRIKDGRVLSRRTLAETPKDPRGLDPSFARFHIDSKGGLDVVVAGTLHEADKRTRGNFIARVPAEGADAEFARIELKHPFGNFFTATPRGGTRPSDVIDLFGVCDDGPNLRYAKVRLIEP